MRDSNQLPPSEAELKRRIAENPDDVEAHYWLAKRLLQSHYQNQGDPFLAESELKLVLDLQPDHAEAAWGLSHLLLSRGRAEEAELVFTNGLAKFPNKADWHYGYATVLLAQKKVNEAEKAYRSALQLDPKHVEAAHELGWLLRGLGRKDEAEAVYRQALRHLGRHADLRSELVSLLAEQGKNEAVEALMKEALVQSPKDATVYLDWGTWQLKRNRLAEAEKALRQAIQLDAQLIGAYYALGKALAAQDKAADVQSLYKQLMPLDPEETPKRFYGAIASYLMAEAALSGDTTRRQLDQAITYYRLAIDLAPKDAKLLEGLGVALESRERWDEAAHIYGELFNLDPSNAYPLAKQATILAQLGKWPGAEAGYRAALKLKNAPHARGVLLNNLGYVLERSGRLDQAEWCYRQALLEIPQSATCHHNLSRLWRSMGRDREALAELRKAEGLDPSMSFVDSPLLPIR